VLCRGLDSGSNIPWRHHHHHITSVRMCDSPALLLCATRRDDGLFFIVVKTARRLGFLGASQRHLIFFLLLVFAFLPFFI
jgi:hypothetical protein